MYKMYRRPYEESSDEYDTQGYDTLKESEYIKRLERALYEERKKYSEAQREIKALSSKYARKENDFESERKRIIQESASQISTLEILLAAEREVKPKRSPSATEKKSLNLRREDHDDLAKSSQESERKRHVIDRFTRDMENLEDHNRKLQDKNASLQSEVNRLSVQTDKDGIAIRSLKAEVNTVLTLLQRSKGLNYEYEETIRTLTEKNHELELENKRLKEHHENYETTLRSLQQDRYHYMISKQSGFDPLIHSTTEGRNKTIAGLSTVVDKGILSQEASAKDDGKTQKIESLEKEMEQLRHENESLRSKLEDSSKKIHSEDESTDLSSSDDSGSEDSKNTNSGNTDHTTGDLTGGVSRATETEKPVHSSQLQDKDIGKSSSAGASQQEGNNSQGSKTNKEQDTRT